MSISVLNTDAGLSGKTIINLEDGQTVTGLKTFDRDPNPPFAVSANSAVVPNLIAESLSGGTVAATTGTFSSTLAVTGIITGRDVTVITSTTTGATNNWAPGIVAGTTLIKASGAALAATGLDGGTSGCVVIIKNTGSGTLTFAHASGSSDADNRFTNLVTSVATPVGAGGYVIYVHDGTDWKMVAHEQGAWITYTPTWGNTGTANTVGDAAVSGQYRVQGRQVHYKILFTFGSTSAAGSSVFTFTLPLTAVANSSPRQCHGSSIISDVSVGAYTAIIEQFTTTTVVLYNTDALTSGVGNGVPMVWVAGDAIAITGLYEIS